MKTFNTDLEKIGFLLEADADLHVHLLAADLPAATEAAQAEGKIDLTTEELPPDERPKYVTNFIGSKQKLVDWIWSNTPESAESVFDAFSGSSVVGYMYKTKGLRVVANDRLAYCHHAARAIVENNDVRLSEPDVEKLLAEKNPGAGDFIQKNFHGIFFKNEVLSLLDVLRANVDALAGFKKSMALFALGKTCMSGGGFGHFSSSTKEGRRHYTRESFLETYRDNLYRINALVFDNGKKNEAHNEDILDVAPKVRTDLAYFDPPYATQFSSTNYEMNYHFVEGLMDYWKGKEIDREKKIRNYKMDADGVTPSNARQFFEGFLSAAKHIPHWLISYRDHAYPSEGEIKKIVADLGKGSRMKSKDHAYQLAGTNRQGDASHAKERLFICAPAAGQQKAAADMEESGRLYTEALEAVAVWEETPNEIRHRVRDPGHFQPDTFRTKQLDGVEGVSIVVARLKKEFLEEGDDPESTVVQAYRFKRKKDDGETLWTMEKAKTWIEEHGRKEADAEEGLFARANMEEIAALSLDGAFDPDLLSAIAGQTENLMVTGYIGSKHFIMNWIDRSFPKDAKSLFDAFSGGANVAYFYKRKGLRVVTNDIMRYPYHIARAVIENNAETVSDEELDALLEKNPGAGSFITDTFYGYYYTKPILEFLDNAWANIQKLKGYKKDIALAALGHACKAKAVFGMYNRSKKNRTYKASELTGKYRVSSIGNLPLSDFVDSFKKYVRQLNRLVYDNGQENKAFNDDVLKVIPQVKADVVYCDPPYITEFMKNDYGDYYHFVEGLMTRWNGKEILDTPRKNFASKTRYDKTNIGELIRGVVEASAKRFPHILMSYRDKAFPTEQELKEIVGSAYGAVKVKKIAVQYNIVKNDPASGGKHANELLFVAEKGKARAASDERPVDETAHGAERVAVLNHTRLVADIRLAEGSLTSAGGLSACEDAQAGLDPEGTQMGDKAFRFVLCHSGTNKNGDFFSPEELRDRHPTAVNKKIDLKHSQDFTDIVGGVVASNFVEEGDKAWVECVGELYTNDNLNARLAYKLMKKGVITQVSMECDYEEGECSICGKRVKSKADYCVHLKKFKGGEFQGKPVFEILHGVTFTGLGLLDRKGADENARIKQVAALPVRCTQTGDCGCCSKTSNEGGFSPMDEEARKKQAEAEEAEAAKKKDGGEGGKDARIKELEEENRTLKSKLEEAQKELEKLKAEQQAAARRTRAEKLVNDIAQRGVAFDGDEDRDAEIKRLADLSDEAFSAAEAAFKRFKKPKGQDGEGTPEEEEKKKKKEPQKKAKADGGEPMRSDAGVRPLDIDDGGKSLEEKLKGGFMAAYQDRVGAAG